MDAECAGPLTCTKPFCMQCSLYDSDEIAALAVAAPRLAAKPRLPKEREGPQQPQRPDVSDDSTEDEAESGAIKSAKHTRPPQRLKKQRQPKKGRQPAVSQAVAAAAAMASAATVSSDSMASEPSLPARTKRKIPTDGVKPARKRGKKSAAVRALSDEEEGDAAGSVDVKDQPLISAATDSKGRADSRKRSKLIDNTANKRPQSPVDRLRDVKGPSDSGSDNNKEQGRKAAVRKPKLTAHRAVADVEPSPKHQQTSALEAAKSSELTGAASVSTITLLLVTGPAADLRYTFQALAYKAMCLFDNQPSMRVLVVSPVASRTLKKVRTNLTKNGRQLKEEECHVDFSAASPADISALLHGDTVAGVTLLPNGPRAVAPHRLVLRLLGPGKPDGSLSMADIEIGAATIAGWLRDAEVLGFRELVCDLAFDYSGLILRDLLPRVEPLILPVTVLSPCRSEERLVSALPFRARAYRLDTYTLALLACIITDPTLTLHGLVDRIRYLVEDTEGGLHDGRAALQIVTNAAARRSPPLRELLGLSLRQLWLWGDELLKPLTKTMEDVHGQHLAAWKTSKSVLS